MFGVKERNKYENPVNNKNNIVIDKQVLYGADIRFESAPVHNQSNYKIIFSDENNQFGFGLSEDVLSKHLLLLGGIGSGKTNTFNHIIDSLQDNMTNDDIMIIFDTKGDYKNEFYDIDNKDHILLGNDVSYRSVSKSWNIFDELRNSYGDFDEKESMLIAKELSKQLFKDFRSANQPFFATAAADIVSKVLIHLIREQKNASIRHKLSTHDFVDYIQRADAVSYHKMLYSHEDFRSAITYLGVTKEGGMRGNQGLGVIAEINSMLNDLFIGPFAEDYGNGSISIRDLVRKKQRKIVFIEYDMSVGEVLGPMYRILFDLALKESLGGRNKNRGNTYLIIDEASLLPGLIHLQDALNFGRSLGVKVFAGLQNITQLYDVYGEEKGKVIAAGFMNSFCFQTWDLESRKFITERFGSNYQNLSYIYSGDIVKIQREGSVVEDWDILNLKVGEAFINLTEDEPVRFKFKFREFKPRIQN